MGIPWNGMGWDRHNLLWDGMGWDRKICPMDKPGDGAAQTSDVNRAAQRSNLIWRILPRTAPRCVQIMKSLHLNFKQILLCIMLLLGLPI